MDEDLGVKAPVTRLRRRMSVEAEDSPLPTTPSTPTKKRSTRLAAKPQLELIDEVATENVPKRTTRKAAAKENHEADSNTGTPTPLTPSRRSTRIRSNTSILSETATLLNVESPRAKRALRRNSQLGSDTESAITPARQTRQTRKSSTSVDKQQAGTGDGNISSVTLTNNETSSKDPGKDTPKESEVNRADNQSPTTRKSPRLQNKKGGKLDNETDKSLSDSQNHVKPSHASPATKINNIQKEINDTASPKENKTEKEILPTSINNLVNEIKSKDKTNSALNKSTSAIENIANDLKDKRNRTKSWTTLSSSASNIAISDNEETKQKLKDNKAPNTNISGSGDGLSLSEENKNSNEPIKSPNRSSNTSTIENSNLVSQDQISESERHKSDTVKLFEKSPNHQQPFVLIEDSDSCSVGKLSIDIQIEAEDQCVPVVDNPSTNESPSKREQSVEPMDIDESMPVNVTIDDFSDKSNTSKDDAEVSDKRKVSVSEKSLLNDESIEKSKRKSSISIQAEENKRDSINKSKNSSILVKENYSTCNQGMLIASTIEKSFLQKDGNDSRKSLDKSQRKSSTSIGDKDKEKLNESSNKSKRKSSISKNESAITQISDELEKSLDKSQRKSSISIAEHMNDSSNKSKRKSSQSQINIEIGPKSNDDEGNDNKKINKSKKNSLVSQINSLNHEQRGNENKSTLIISQLKDMSTNDTNNAISPNVTNIELSKSMNGSDVKNKGINKKNSSLNYLTSTPIQQKPLQKLTMQINTSIISPAEKNQNNTSAKTPKKNTSKQSDSSDETDEDIKFKNKIKNDSFVALKKPSRASSSSESSEDESESKKAIKRVINKLPNKKVPAPESSDSDELDSENLQNNKKTPKKKVVNHSDSVKKSPKMKVPTLDSSDSEESDSESHQKNRPNNKIDSQSKSEPKSHVEKLNKKPPADSSDDSDSDEEASKDISNIVDDEASEASDDYESGDSRSETDRRYEAENEIKEKGETLDSEEEFSNDSDYEKDSFLVSSDAEDHEILSGTGDDLSLSDNELNMSAKSKNKFNERKLKQQKNASKEMYEARHKVDESAKSKKKRQRLESSTLESENENTQPKKSNRQRIDSSQDSCLDKSDAEESIGIKKKKSKRLSESVQDITSNEKEITIFNQSITEKNDPLTVAIKQEPKTPQKHFDISTIAINDKIEEVEIDSNASLIKRNETLDPLQATMVADDVEDSSSSDNMEIIQNYDSILNNLNMQTKKIKTVDTSLNYDTKSKNSKDPMIDQLNLTQTRKPKKNNNKTPKEKSIEIFKSSNKEASKVVRDEDSSDSIDMKLLFPEESTDSEINASQFKPDTNKENEENFIPLRRTEGQTNIPGNMETNTSVLNESKKKNKKRKLSNCESKEVPINTEEPDDSSVKIFIDTTGTHELDTSMANKFDLETSSSKKKKNKRNKSINEELNVLESAVEIDCTDGVAETPVEVSFASEKKKKKNKNKSINLDLSNVENTDTLPHSEKKPKKSVESTPQTAETNDENIDSTVVEDMPNTSIKSDKKKKKNKHDVSQNIEPVVEAPSSARKHKKSSISLEDVVPETQNIEQEETPAETSTSEKKKKKKKNKQVLEASVTAGDDAGDDSDAPMEMSYKSEKKSDATDAVTDDALTNYENKKHKKNKKKKRKKLSQSMEKSDDNVKSFEQDNDVSIKRKRKASGNSTIETENDPNSILVQTLSSSHEKKKRKIQLENECIAAYNDNEQKNSDAGSLKKAKKNKKSKNIDVIAGTEKDEGIKHNSKKRKNRDDDNEEQIHKVSKQNSLDKIHVPKLPESVIDQLTERPQNKRNKKKNSKSVIATMPFVVEEAERRKNKPSNYLEQSIYLNDTPVKTKQKHSKDKPKVLPFIPTALTSDSGYTSKFNINVLPEQTQFVAQASNVVNFKESFLGTQRIKKLGTFERCKIHRSQKISKF